MAVYKVKGNYTISFEMEVEADSLEEAEQMGYNLNIETEWNGNSVFCDEAELNADGEVFNIEAEFVRDDEDDDDEYDDEDEEE